MQGTQRCLVVLLYRIAGSITDLDRDSVNTSRDSLSIASSTSLLMTSSSMSQRSPSKRNIPLTVQRVFKKTPIYWLKKNKKTNRQQKKNQTSAAKGLSS